MPPRTVSAASRKEPRSRIFPLKGSGRPRSGRLKPPSKTSGLIVLVAPRFGAIIVAGWLGGIIINLLTKKPPQYYDIALRDLGLMLAALALARLAWSFHSSPTKKTPLTQVSRRAA
jgi:hypothetical protein